jgi:hypothetical protein
MSLTDRADVAEDPVFLRRVRQAMVGAAIDVAAEDPNTSNHAARRLLASQILANPNGWAAVYAVGVAQNPNIGIGGNDDPAVSDSPMPYVVNSLFNAYTAPVT